MEDPFDKKVTVPEFTWGPEVEIVAVRRKGHPGEMSLEST
jgi:hypothetical protein